MRRHTNSYNYDVCVKCGLIKQMQFEWPLRQCKPKYSNRRMKVLKKEVERIEDEVNKYDGYRFT